MSHVEAENIVLPIGNWRELGGITPPSWKFGFGFRLNVIAAAACRSLQS
jgi:hypothetical protein